MKPAIVLRHAQNDDLEDLLVLLDSNALPVDGVHDWLKNFYLAIGDGRIVGAAGYESYESHALLRSVVVDASLRGLGIGDQLVNKVLADLRATGIDDVYLLTTTADDYFPRFGFAQIDRSEVPEALHASVEFSHACPSTARVLRRSI